MFVQTSIDEIVGGPDDPPPLGIKCGSEIVWYKKGSRVKMQTKVETKE